MTGHSRTIIGCEVLHKNSGGSGSSNGLRLLVLDPSHGAAQLEAGALRALRRAPPALRARQYQLVAIRGLMEDDQEYEVGICIYFFFFSNVIFFHGFFPL